MGIDTRPTAHQAGTGPPSRTLPTVTVYTMKYVVDITNVFYDHCSVHVNLLLSVIQSKTTLCLMSV